MTNVKIYADFHNADPQGRLRLNSIGTQEDLSRRRVSLAEGMTLLLYSDDLDERGQPDELLVDGVVTWSSEEKCWVAVIDWTAIGHASSRAGLPGKDEASAHASAGP